MFKLEICTRAGAPQLSDIDTKLLTATLIEECWTGHHGYHVDSVVVGDHLPGARAKRQRNVEIERFSPPIHMSEACDWALTGSASALLHAASRFLSWPIPLFATHSLSTESTHR